MTSTFCARHCQSQTTNDLYQWWSQRWNVEQRKSLQQLIGRRTGIVDSVDKAIKVRDLWLCSPAPRYTMKTAHINRHEARTPGANTAQKTADQTSQSCKADPKGRGESTGCRHVRCSHKHPTLSPLLNAPTNKGTGWTWTCPRHDIANNIKEA